MNTKTLFDAQKCPPPRFRQQGNPLFECKGRLPLERVAGMIDDEEFAEPTHDPAGLHSVHCHHYRTAGRVMQCEDCKRDEFCRLARKRGLLPNNNHETT